MRRPTGRKWLARTRSWWRPRYLALAAVLILFALVGGGSGMASQSLRASDSPPLAAMASPSPARTLQPVATANARPTPRPSPSATPARAPAADIRVAIESRLSWVPYASSTFRFAAEIPPDWAVSETQTPGWAVIWGWDGSNIAVTWRPTPPGTTLGVVTDEVWKSFHDSGFVLPTNEPGTIAGLPARILTADGPDAAGHLRHGIIGIVATDTGRYRVELWSRPGTEDDDWTLFNTFIFAFTTT
jgi:hypothetical protein